MQMRQFVTKFYKFWLMLVFTGCLRLTRLPFEVGSLCAEAMII